MKSEESVLCEGSLLEYGATHILFLLLIKLNVLEPRICNDLSVIPIYLKNMCRCFILYAKLFVSLGTTQPWTPLEWIWTIEELKTKVS